MMRIGKSYDILFMTIKLPRYWSFIKKVFAKFITNLHTVSGTCMGSTISNVLKCAFIIHYSAPNAWSKNIKTCTFFVDHVVGTYILFPMSSFRNQLCRHTVACTISLVVCGWAIIGLRYTLHWLAKCQTCSRSFFLHDLIDNYRCFVAESIESCLDRVKADMVLKEKSCLPQDRMVEFIHLFQQLLASAHSCVESQNFSLWRCLQKFRHHSVGHMLWCPQTEKCILHCKCPIEQCCAIVYNYNT